MSYYARTMNAPERVVSQRELRDHMSSILQEVASGTRVRVTVAGQPVAELVPLGERRRFVPRSTLERLLREAPLDDRFMEDVDALTGHTLP